MNIKKEEIPIELIEELKKEISSNPKLMKKQLIESVTSFILEVKDEEIARSFAVTFVNMKYPDVDITNFTAPDSRLESKFSK